MQVYMLSWALLVAFAGSCLGEVGDTINIDDNPDAMPAAVMGAEGLSTVEGSGQEPSQVGMTTDDEDLMGELGSGTTIGNNEIVDPVISLTTLSARTASSNNLPSGDHMMATSTSSNGIGGLYDETNDAQNINDALGQNGERSDGPNKEPQKFFEKIIGNPAILAGMVGAVVLILLTVVLLFLFVVYRIKKKDEGSYSLDEPHKVKDPTAYWKDTKEFYA